MCELLHPTLLEPKALPMQKKNIKNVINIRMFIICPSVLRPDLASKK